MKEWKNKNSGKSSNKKGKNSSNQSNTTMDLKKARIRFIEIANKTGIHGEKIIKEPNPQEREELWGITRSFLNRIYTLDDTSNLSKEELEEYHELCYWSIAALHWNDYFGEAPLQYPGRFRRDTIALALCLYIRISKDYEVHKNIEKEFIQPHMYGSVMLWVCSEMKTAKRDIYFNKFDVEFIKKADEQRGKFFIDRGGLFLTKEDKKEEYDKVVEILYELLDTFHEVEDRSFPQFILTYIKTLKELLSEDLKKNTKYIESILSSSSTPESFDISKEITLKMIQNSYSGKGKYTYDTGDIYVGDFKDSRPHGKGTYTFKNGDKQSGEWKYGNMHGFSIEEKADGAIYKGEYKEDKKDGFGEFTWPDGDSYIGEFSNGKMNGKGIFKTGDKEYSGTYKDGKLISKDPFVDFSLKVRNIALQKEHGFYEEKETGDLNKPIEKMQDGSLFEEKIIHPNSEKTVKESSSSVYEIISKGIQKSKALPNQPFIKEELETQGFKNLPKRTPWFFINSVAFNISGKFEKGCLLVDMDGFYSNCVPDTADDELKFIMPWDSIYNLKVNDDNDDGIPDGITELLLYTDENKNPEEAKCLSIINKMEDSSKLNSPFSVIKSIYDNMWKRMIDKFRGQPIVWTRNIDWFTQEVFSSNEELIDFYSNYKSKDKEKKTKDQKEKEALEKFGTTKKDLAEKVLKNISVSQENPEAYAFVKAVSAKGAKMQDILNKYEHIFEENINFADEDGYTAIHYACWDNKRIILEMLIDFGANPNVLSKTNESPINMAVVSGHLDIVQFFVDYDVEMELKIDWENRNKTENKDKIN